MTLLSHYVLNLNTKNMQKSKGIDHYLKIVKFFLSLVGQWPYQLPRYRIFCRTIGLGISTIILFPGFMAMYEVRNESTTFVECIPPIFAVFASYCYAICYSLNIKKIESLTECMKSDWELIKGCKTELEIIERSAQKGKTYITVFAIYSYVSSSVYVMSPLLPQLLDLISPLNESRARLFVFHVDYVFIDKEEYYYFIYIHAMLAAYITLTNIISIDFLFLSTVQHACGMFQLLGYRLAHVVDKNYKIIEHDVIKDQKVNKKMIKCIQLYNDILKFTEMIEFCFSNMFLFIIGINMLMISFQGVQIVLNLNNTQILMRFGSFFMGQIIHLYFNTIPGQMLIDESSKL
ncbi:uncharacterized protein LOC127289122 isoform X2 [Leptopilina boulardi]|uniref:uncharacterized protein LOC127289122 isoform X2 n=1 Tax=Leptopilina boulardi TaxID=63433 RepID=UPI0021F5C70A|nr:uncharacterized protein LOC127289122 isoform X2 [Leptopilina boulardi]